MQASFRHDLKLDGIWSEFEQLWHFWSELFYNVLTLPSVPLHEKCTYSELFRSVFSRIRTEYGVILPVSLYSVQIWENTDQNNSK